MEHAELTPNPWEGLTEESLAAKGLNASVAHIIGNYILLRNEIETERRAVLTAVDTHNTAIQAAKAELSVLDERDADNKRKYIGVAVGEVNLPSRLREAVAIGSENDDLETLLSRIKFADNLKKFSERLQAEPGVPVLRATWGGHSSLLLLQAGRSNGQPLTVTEEKPSWSNATQKKLTVPMAGYIAVNLPAFTSNVPEVQNSTANLSGSFPYYSRDKICVHPSQLITELNLTHPRATLGSNDLWFVGDDTILELCKIVALQGEVREDAWGFEITRLAAATRSNLLLLRQATSRIGLDIEEIPTVKSQLDSWRQLVRAWAADDYSLEPSTEIVRNFNNFHDKIPEYDVRPKFIKYLRQTLVV